MEAFSSHRRSAEESTFRDLVRGVVFKFVKGNLDGMWKPFPGEVALLDRNLTLVGTTFREKRCNFWQAQGLLDYAWVS